MIDQARAKLLAGESKLTVLAVVAPAATRLWEVDTAASYRRRLEAILPRALKEATQSSPSQSNLPIIKMHLTSGQGRLPGIIGDQAQDSVIDDSSRQINSIRLTHSIVSFVVSSPNSIDSTGLQSA